MPRSPRLAWLPFVPAALAPALLLLAPAAPAGAVPPPAPAEDCAAPRPGRYVGMGRGTALGDPVAVLLQETWKSDGTLSGLRLERRGRTYAEVPYTGSYRAISQCRAAIERTYGADSFRSQAVLDRTGQPRFSLVLFPNVVIASSWVEQPAATCSAALLNGTVLSLQEGLDWVEGRWKPNAVVQREHWSGGTVSGLAVSSYGTTLEEATYKGTIEVGADCLATVKQRDSLGKPYAYRAIVRADGGGYFYLQTDPDDLTVGRLDRLRP